jgi:hypothetical protein
MFNYFVDYCLTKLYCAFYLYIYIYIYQNIIENFQKQRPKSIPLTHIPVCCSPLKTYNGYHYLFAIIGNWVGLTSVVETGYHSGRLNLLSVFSGVHIAQTLVFCVVVRGLLFVFLSFLRGEHWIVCPFIYGFLLLVWYL